MICLPLLGILAGYILMERPVTLHVNGETREVNTRALTVRGALRSAGIDILPQDLVEPASGSWLSRTTEITVETARRVFIYTDPDGALLEVVTPAKTAAEILSVVGLQFGEGDRVRVNGDDQPLDVEIPIKGDLTLQYTPAVTISLTQGGEQFDLQVSPAPLGQALWLAGVQVRGGDSLSASFDTPVTADLALTLTRGTPLSITADGRTITTYVAASTVGQALALAGVPLQDMDYSKPAEDESLPADGKIEVIRVREEVLQEEQYIPYDTVYQPDASLNLGADKEITPGQYGLEVARVRVRYENGVEISRIAEQTVLLYAPVDRVVAAGTNGSSGTLDTPSGPLAYALAITGVTVTSYSPCNSGVNECLYQTADGSVVQKGVIAVHLAWYRQLKGKRIYIPGYGIGRVADTGAYPYNSRWVDLGFTDAEFDLEAFTKQNITVYLLDPAPGFVP